MMLLRMWRCLGNVLRVRCRMCGVLDVRLCLGVGGVLRMRLSVGSVAHNVLLHAPCSVLVVRAASQPAQAPASG